MSYSPTIVAASLNDKDLKDSIDKLVQHVDQGTKKMVQSMNIAVDQMKRKLTELGNMPVNFGAGSVGDGTNVVSRRTRAQKEETDAVRANTAARKEQTQTLDQQASALQKVTQPKSARESFYAFAQGFKEQAQHLQQLINQWESLQLARRIGDFNAVGAAIDQTTQKISALKGEITQLRKDQPTGYRDQIKERENQIEMLRQKIVELRQEQQRIANAPIGENDYIRRYREQLEQANNAMRDNVSINRRAQQQATQTANAQQQAQQQATQSASRYTEEIRKQAQAIRESADYKAGKNVLFMTPNGYEATLNIKDKVSIEQKLLETYEKETSQKSQLDRLEQEENQHAKERLGTEMAIAGVMEKQKRAYSSPDTKINESFRKMVANRLGINTDELNKAGTSVQSLTAYLKQLQTAYQKTNATQRNSPFGKQLREEIQLTERELAKLRSQMARPISFSSAMALPERTLDDLAYKMRQLQAYRNNIDISNPKNEKAKQELDDVSAALNKLKQKQNEILGTNKTLLESNNALSRSWNYMKNRLAFYFTVGASTQFVKNLINIRGQYELLERSIGILFDSMQTGTKIFSELNAMAIKSPFTTMELGAAAKQLSAYNIAAKDVVDTTRRLADIAAAVGVPIERLTYALGQIKSYGYLNSRDARMFANAGIPLIQNLADMYTKLEGRMVSIGDVYDRIKHKQVSFEDTLKVVNEMTDEGGRFFNFQEKAADTLVVRLANLTLAWNNMLNELGKDNTGLINNTLGGLKTIFEHWRDIDAAIWGVVKVVGILKGAQLLWLTLVKRTSVELVLANTLGQTLGYKILGIGLAMKSLAANPVTWIAAAVVSAGYLYQKWRDLEAANEAFNKSVADGAQENINSTNKFFEKYRKEINSIGSVSSADQEKMWERVRDEIEKTTKNAQQYIDILEKIPNVAERVGKASGYLEHQQVLQQEVKRMADHELFNMGGGFANDSLAKDLRDYEKTMNSVLKRYDSLEAAQKDFNDSMMAWSSGHYAVKYYNEAVKEAEDELNNFTASLDKADIARIKGNGSYEEQLANIRSFAQLVRDNFLATEEGQKISTEGQALLNKEIDNWIAAQGIANNLINKQRAEVEKNRSAWEVFFNQLNAEEKRAVDYLINTGKITTDEFKKIWNDAADRMKESSKTAYEQIQSHIADLRNTAPIVIDVIYRETKESKDEAQKDFEKRFTTPKGKGVLSAEAYTKEEKRLNTIYGRFNKKADEDMVEWEQRLGQEYQDNEKKLASYNKMLEGYNKLTDEQKKKRETQINTVTKERDALQATQNTLEEIRSYENFDFEQFKKGKKSGKGGSKKDPLLDALKQEISLVEKLQSDYDKLSKSGAPQADALDTIRGAYGKTIRLLNTQLQSYGLPQIDISQLITGKDPNKTLAHFKQTLDTLVSKGMLTLERSKELEAVVEKFTLSAKTYNLDMITKGLNNELGKLKDEYELAVELDANPELGDMFADMFGINTSTLPKTFGDALDRAQTIINRKLAEMNITTPFDLMEGNIDSFAKSAGLSKESEVIKELVSAQNSYRDMFKKNITETEKVLDDYIKKYGDYSDKIAEIEASRLEKLKKLNEAYYTEEMRKRPEYVAKLNAIEQGASKEKQQVDFEEFKNSRYYTMMFENLDYISTKTIRDMRDRVRELMDTMNDLTPEQLKTLISQYEKLEQKLVKRSPFKTLTKDLKEYLSTSKERKAANQEFKNAQKEYDTQKKNVAALKEKYEQAKANSNTSKSYLDFLQIEIGGENEILQILRQQLDAAQEKADKYNLTAKLAKSEALAVAQVVGQNLQSLGELRDFLQQDLGVELSDELNGLVDGLSKVGQGINKITSSATSGDVVGVITGVGQTIYGLYDGIASIFGGGSAAGKKITKQIQDSERAVKRLELAYIDLEHAISEAYGSSVVGAKRILAVTKELELAELERQLTLEQSRKKKDQDADKILDLQKRIKELRYEISDSIREITDDLLGSDVGSFAENLVSEMAEAFKSGEDYMKVFNEKFDNMIDNMIIKSIVSKVVSQRINAIWDSMDATIKERSQAESDNYAEAIKKREEFESKGFAGWVRETTGLIVKDVEKFTSDDWGKKMYNTYNKLLDTLKVAEQEAKDAYDAATQIGDSDINALIKQVTDIKPELAEKLKEALGLYWKFGKDSSESQLSALQQGIQGVTEDTAGAIEAYMNGVSQQVYLHSDLLTQIRDTIIGFNMDIQLGTLSEILLQLQNSYMIMQTMSQMMSNWTTDIGNGIRVELVS